MFPLLFVLHPSQGHWRWAIYHTSEQGLRENPSQDGAINAGLQPTREAADDIGQQCLYTLLSFISLTKGQAPVTALSFDHDLVPAGVPLTAHQGAANFVQMGV